MSGDSTIISEHSGTIMSGLFSFIGAILVGISRFLVKREVRHMDERHASLQKQMDEGRANLQKQVDDINDKHDIRLRAMESTVATKTDIQRLDAKSEERIAEMTRLAEARHLQIIGILTNSSQR